MVCGVLYVACRMWRIEHKGCSAREVVFAFYINVTKKELEENFVTGDKI